jgi:hypothetical protein
VEIFEAMFAITPGKLKIVMAVLVGRFGLARLMRADRDIVFFDVAYDAGSAAQERLDKVIGTAFAILKTGAMGSGRVGCGA